MGLNPEESEVPTSLVDALLVYAEPLAQNAHAVVIGDSESAVAERLLEGGARSVYVFDPDPARVARVGRDVPRGVIVKPFIDELDVRDGMFDLAVIPDVADLNDPRDAIARLRAAMARNGSLVALGRARIEGDAPSVFRGKLGQAALSYDDLYDLFAGQFEDVALTGVLPFTGVVFAQLGVEDPAVSVETRLVTQASPSVFVVVASDGRPEELDPYAIVQIDEVSEAGSREEKRELETAAAALQLKTELLQQQIDSLKDRLVVSDVRALEMAASVERAVVERDAALTRAMEIEAVLAAAQQSLGAIERTLLEAERGMLDRDDRIAQLSAELDARNSATGSLNEVLLRAERAEAALAIAREELSSRINPTALERADRAEQELAVIAEAHAAETAAYESQLRDRARFIAALEKELVRREQLVKELVASVEEVHGAAGNHVFEASPPMPMPMPMPPAGSVPSAEIEALKAKLDELAQEVARREGELTARGWKITELENRLRAAPPPSKLVAPAPAPEPAPAPAPAPAPVSAPSEELRKLRDELDALRQALAQEHEARLAAESGEELTRARAELARQAVLLEQIRAQRGSS